jgi:hypothetical protein
MLIPATLGAALAEPGPDARHESIALRTEADCHVSRGLPGVRRRGARFPEWHDPFVREPLPGRRLTSGADWFCIVRNVLIYRVTRDPEFADKETDALEKHSDTDRRECIAPCLRPPREST